LEVFVNVKDFDIPIPEGDMLETIFNHQRDLIDKYHSIEEGIVGHKIPSHGSFESVEISDGEFRPRWAHAGALDINDRASQLRMKDFAWRITEELTEATLALGEEDETHYLEELIDALHFSVELLTMCGIEPPLLASGGKDRLEMMFEQSEATKYYRYPGTDSAKKRVYSVIEALGDGMNRLKLKPWKATGVLTDELLFKSSMIRFFCRLIDLLKASGFTARTATAMYLNKNAVNQFRIKSNY
jgi:dUTPase